MGDEEQRERRRQDRSSERYRDEETDRRRKRRSRKYHEYSSDDGERRRVRKERALVCVIVLDTCCISTDWTALRSYSSAG